MFRCCCGSSSVDAVAKEDRKGTGDAPFKQTTAPKFPTMQFDIVVPESGVSDGRAGPDQSMSFNALDRSMVTMRDGVTADGTSGASFGFDNNLSFTNNFNDVNDSAVQLFMQNVAKMAGAGSAVSMIEETLLAHPVVPGDGSAGGRPADVGTGMTAEDIAYVNNGATLEERLTRLTQVEDVLRQGIYGAYQLNTLLVQLAASRIVPTLRQRRRPWAAEATTATAGTAAAGGAKKEEGSRPPSEAGSGGSGGARRPVLVIHSREMELLSQSVRSASPGEVALSEANTSGVFSPASIGRGGGDSVPPSPVPQGGRPHRSGLSNESLSGSMSSLAARLEHSQAKIEHYELLALTGRSISLKHKIRSQVVTDTWDFLSVNGASDTLNAGNIVYRFMCGPLNQMDQETLEMVKLFINVSSFKDEEKENNTPRVNVADESQTSQYIAIIVKNLSILPGVKLSNLTAELVASQEYQKACQPGNPKLEETARPDTFRFVLTIIRFVFSMTIQLRVSEITDPNILLSFKNADGMVPGKAFMLERTKIHVNKVDATAKVRSMLLYYPVNDGVLVNNQTIVLNTSIPTLVSKVVNTFGAQGASMSEETTDLTRKYMAKRFGDSRTGK